VQRGGHEDPYCRLQRRIRSEVAAESLMQRRALLPETPEEHEHEQSRSRALIGLVVIALLVIAAVYLIHALRSESNLEDCLMSGRSNCAPIETPSGNR
jgi:hypothetical protein